MIYCFDLDGTLCTNTNGKYARATPYLERIKKVNQLYSDGNYIIINSARGSNTGINWYDTTEKQIKSWGINFHELHVGRSNGRIHSRV